MKITRYSLWDNIPGTTTYEPWIEHYKPESPICDSAFIIVPGSAYAADPDIPKQEGERVARYYCEMGINVFCLRYRVKPDYFPLPVLDGRRAVRYVRYHSKIFGINKNKIAAMGYSSGGHLTASLFAYTDKIDYEDVDDVDKECFIPNYQILCYPVIGLNKGNYYIHKTSPDNLLGNKYEKYKDILSLELSKVENIAPTFIWHNFDDEEVSVVNSLKYVEALRKKGASVEMHIFPDGGHGIGLPVEDNKVLNHDRQWIELLTKWLQYKGFMEK